LNVEVFPTDEWGATVATRLAARARRPGLRLCLPTGSTPRPAYAALAARHGVLAGTEVFLLDEFVLPPGHPARCDSMLQRDLLDLLDVAPAALHRLDVAAADREGETARYDALVRSGGLDLTLLGLGMNGHLGLNEPGSTDASPTRFARLTDATIRSAAAYGGDRAPEWGATLGLATILASREIWLLVTGAHKAEILQRVVKGPIGPDVPATYLRQHPNTVVLADENALSGV
jgi:glucosamine-6-phosphate deaminase